ncbi:CO2 hydration protein [Parathermosynechococcus lividus]
MTPLTAVTGARATELRAAIIERLLNNQALLPDSPTHVMEVVGILKSYGIVLKAYAETLCDISERQFLVLFPFFKYFNGEITLPKLLRHWWHDRINYEYAEYCMRAMMWHGGGGLDAFLDSVEFRQLAAKAIAAKLRGNPFMQLVNGLFPEFLLETVRMLCYYSGLGQFWSVMYPIFLTLSDRYDAGEIRSIPDVVDHIRSGLIADAAHPITYRVQIRGNNYDIVPASAQLTFLPDTAIPYVEAVFLRGTPFFGLVSFNAQAQQISRDQGEFSYGALFADPIPTGAAGIPPTLLMQDMRHYLPPYLHEFYRHQGRGEDDLRVKICQTFQKSMFCVTTAAITALAPYPWTTRHPAEQAANREFYEQWLERLATSRLWAVQT